MDKKDFITNIIRMYCVIPVNIAGLYAIYCLLNDTVQYWWLYTLIGYIAMMMCGIAACYHRLLSHKSFKTYGVIKTIFLWFAAISGQGSPMFWVGVHRCLHHGYTDSAKDPHSPIHGFWHSYFLWILKFDHSTINIRGIADLFRDSACVFFHKWYGYIFFGTHLLVAYLDFTIWLYMFALPAFLTFHSNCINTSFNHFKFMGYKNFETRDNSVNSVWLWPLIQGETWHNNHHNQPNNPNYGYAKWWEIDPTYWIIKAIRIDK